MAFPQLPNELLLAIISSIAPSDHATLHSCQLTSRAFREFSTPVLYGRIDITWMPTQGIALFDAFDQMPWLRDLVKSATVDFPGFQEAGRVSSRFDEIVARLWEAEKRRWSTILLDADPEEVDLRENQWRDEFEDHLEAIDEELYVQAEKEAWTDLRRTGDDEWLGMGPYDDEGRSGGGEMLAFLLASLPNLRRLDFTNWDCGSSPLPRLTYLAIQYTETCFPPRPPLLPYTRNVEELFVDGSFLLPPQYQLPTLHTLRIGPEIDTNLLSELLKKSCNTIKTLEVSVDVDTSLALATILPPHLLSAAPGLEKLCISRPVAKVGFIDESLAFSSYLSHSTLRAVSLPIRPSPRLFASLPPTIERVTMTEPGDADGPITSLDLLLVEKARLPRLVRVEMRGCWRDVPGASDSVRDKVAVEHERVLQGRLLGIEIVLQ